MQRKNEDTYKIFHGMKPVKRQARRDNQSGWYYLDPRGAENFSDMKEIGVESENSPNPKIKAILDDDMHKNPDDYYVWRTKKDDKVRDSHREREGKVFNRHVPPEGGHPGEDHNCRCWAETYRPDLMAHLNITPKVDLSGLPQYAANDKTGSVSDAKYVSAENDKVEAQDKNAVAVPVPTPKPEVPAQTTAKKIVPVPARKPLTGQGLVKEMLRRYVAERSAYLQPNLAPLNSTNSYTTELGNMAIDAPIQFVSNQYISDEDLYARMWENIKEQEGVMLYPYLDTKGLITIGGGANVNDWNVFKNLNVTVDGIPATEEQKWETYQKLIQMSNEKDNKGNYVNRNLRADVFEDKTNIRISDAEARRLAQNHMNNDLAHLRREFSDFDSFPLPLKEVLLDIQYNVIGGVNPNDWPNLYRAIRNRDINGIVANVHRKDVQQSRNDWAKQTARSIRF